MSLELPGTDTQEQLRELVAPLREQRTKLVATIEALARALASERKTLQQIDVVLARLDPEHAPRARRNGKGTGEASRHRAVQQLVNKVDEVEQCLLRHADEVEDGFSSTSLIRLLHTWGGPGLSSISVPKVLEALRERGLIRADRVGQGGGMVWKLVR